MPNSKQTNTDRLLDLAEEKGILRAREVEKEGIPRQYLSRLTRRGELERIGRGLYQRPDHEPTAHHSLAVAAKRIPKARICLLSALRFHELTTQNPFDVWISIGHKDRRPKVENLSLQVVRMSGKARREGVEEHHLEGVTVPIYNPPKTVADCFKYRSRVGLDVALEALRDFYRQGGSMDTLWHYAGTCHVQSVIRPYMEAIVS
ncbi:transcriptional regulator [Salinibacter sp. 10B]|uniref:type IV toxin-antitoxin system AbiEi family antitoxin domain-containing protein n=1 Tax=Salinibacter sp. 10B TaxID=1923971 RepID=UPI000CF3A628|nr:AbiEi antitoxin N-terminal domain-containing protein [Salinibacter sp. 10B]PQJ36813.1 transcriptional regulator [Salinibacter sp. 10B]